MSSHPPPCKYDATALHRCQSTEDSILLLRFARLLVQPGSYARKLVDFNYFCLALKMKTLKYLYRLHFSAECTSVADPSFSYKNTCKRLYILHLMKEP